MSDRIQPAGQRGAGLRDWVPHVVCALVAVVLIGVARTRHLSTDEARSIALDPAAPTDARLWAIHVAANRAHGRDPELGDALVRSLLRSEDPRLVEFALTMDLTRHFQGAPPRTGPPPLQTQHVNVALRNAPWTPHRLLATLLFMRKVGGPAFGNIERLDIDEAEWALEALTTGTVPPAPVLDAHFHRRASRVREMGALRGR